MRSHLRWWTTRGTAGRFNDRFSDETGDIISGWLLRLIVFMAILGFLGYELIVIGLNYVNAEEAAQEVARRARTTYRETQNDDLAEESAEAEAEFRDVDLVRFEVTDEHVIVDVKRYADTLVTHQIGFLEGLTERTGMSRVRWRE